MALEGDLRNVALHAVLRSIAARGASGILTVQGVDDIVAISFLKGDIVAADALNQTAEEGLGAVLADRGLISPEDFAAAAEEHQSEGSSLVETLVGRGLVGREELLESLRIQTFRQMLDVLTWRQGDFKFYGGDEISYEEGFQPIPVPELLIRSLEELGDEGPLRGSLPILDAIYRKLPPTAPVQVLGRDGDGDGDGVWISPLQATFLERVDSQTSAAAVARELGLDDYAALDALYVLLRRKLLDVRGEAAPLEPETAGLQAEIFTPPEPGTVARPAPPPKAAGAPAPGALWRRLGPALGALLALILALFFLPRPASYLLPFSWQDPQRQALERQLRRSLYLQIDRAARTYFLVRAHYPDSLEELVELGLLSSAELRDPSGRPLAYSTDEVSYRLEPIGVPEADEGLATTEAITGDFLLDPQWLRPGGSEEAPLVLLD